MWILKAFGVTQIKLNDGPSPLLVAGPIIRAHPFSHRRLHSEYGLTVYAGKTLSVRGSHKT